MQENYYWMKNKKLSKLLLDQTKSYLESIGCYKYHDELDSIVDETSNVRHEVDIDPSRGLY